MMSCTESGPMSCVTAVSLFILLPASCLQLPIPQRAEPEELPRRPCRTAEHRNAGRHVAHDAGLGADLGAGRDLEVAGDAGLRSEEHTSELQSLMRISYAVFCLKKKKQNKNT